MRQAERRRPGIDSSYGERRPRYCPPPPDAMLSSAQIYFYPRLCAAPRCVVVRSAGVAGVGGQGPPRQGVGVAGAWPETFQILNLVTRDSRTTNTSLLMHAASQPYDWSARQRSGAPIGRLAPILACDWLIGSNTRPRLDD